MSDASAGGNAALPRATPDDRPPSMPNSGRRRAEESIAGLLTFGEAAIPAMHECVDSLD